MESAVKCVPTQQGVEALHVLHGGRSYFAQNKAKFQSDSAATT